MTTCILTPLGSAPEPPDRDRVSSWSMASINAHLDAGNRCGLHAVASRAVDLERRNADHFKIMLALAGAEGLAAQVGPEEQAFHAARLDAYASAHQLRGWYRYTSGHGEHRVQVNFLRSGPSDVGRYYAHRLSEISGDPKPYWVVDRDTGRTVATCATNEEAQAWIATAVGHAEDVGSRSVEGVATVGGVL
jgi:hypothetical protein